MKKRLLILALVAVAVTAPVFAEVTQVPTGASTGLNMGFTILGGFMFVINYVFGSMTGKDAGGAGAAGAAEDFFVALKGAIVSTTI